MAGGPTRALSQYVVVRRAGLSIELVNHIVAATWPTPRAPACSSTPDRAMDHLSGSAAISRPVRIFRHHRGGYHEIIQRIVAKCPSWCSLPSGHRFDGV